MSLPARSSLPKNYFKVKPSPFPSDCFQLIVKPYIPQVGDKVLAEGRFCLRCFKFHYGHQSCEIEEILPSGHRYWKECTRETFARWVEWAIAVLPSEDTWFVTFTFKRPISERAALLRRDRWMSRLRQSYFDQNANHERFRWVCALARQKRGVIHFHLLIMASNLTLLSRKSWESRWQRHGWNAGTARIYDKNDIPGLVCYFSREISKEGDLTWGGLWSGLKPPGSVSCCGLTTS